MNNLRDIHLPPAPHWQLAPGWWLLILIGCVLLVFVCYRYYHFRRRQYYLKPLQLQLVTLENLFQTEPHTALMELSLLLKRICLTFFGREPISQLYGEAWLHFLDEVGATKEFSHGIGRCLLNAPYQPTPQVEFEKLMQLIRHWLSKVITYV